MRIANGLTSSYEVSVTRQLLLVMTRERGIYTLSEGREFVAHSVFRGGYVLYTPMAPSRAENLIGARSARQQGAHMLPGLPRAGTIRGLNTISPGLLCPVKVTSISQDCA
jgi:hypothetical protein